MASREEEEVEAQCLLVLLLAVAVAGGVCVGLALPRHGVSRASVLGRLSCPVQAKDFGDVPNAEKLAADLNAAACR